MIHANIIHSSYNVYQHFTSGSWCLIFGFRIRLFDQYLIVARDFGLSQLNVGWCTCRIWIRAWTGSLRFSPVWSDSASNRRYSRSYLSPNVSIAESLEHATKVGGATVANLHFSIRVIISCSFMFSSTAWNTTDYQQILNQFSWALTFKRIRLRLFSGETGLSTRSIRSTCSSRKTVWPCAPRPSRISLVALAENPSVMVRLVTSTKLGWFHFAIWCCHGDFVCWYHPAISCNDPNASTTICAINYSVNSKPSQLSPIDTK